MDAHASFLYFALVPTVLVKPAEKPRPDGPLHQSKAKLRRPHAHEHEETGNPSRDNSLDNAQVPHELAQRLLEVYLDEGGEPQDAPRPPDESVDPVAAVALRNAQEASRDGVDGNKEAVDAIEALVEVEDGVESGIEVGEREQQAGAACVVPRGVCPCATPMPMAMMLRTSPKPPVKRFITTFDLSSIPSKP